MKKNSKGKYIGGIVLILVFIAIYAVTRPKPVEQIEIEQPAVSALSEMNVGDTQQITASILPEDADFDSAEMMLSGEGVVEIDSELIDGNTYTASISAVGEGSTTLWITTTDKKSTVESQQIKITVSDPEREKKEAEEAAEAEQAAKEDEKQAADQQAQETAEEQTQTSDAADDRTVYYTKTGSKYHYQNPCGSGTYYPCTLSEAQSKGLEPCGKCVLR